MIFDFGFYWSRFESTASWGFSLALRNHSYCVCFQRSITVCMFFGCSTRLIDTPQTSLQGGQPLFLSKVILMSSECGEF